MMGDAPEKDSVDSESFEPGSVPDVRGLEGEKNPAESDSPAEPKKSDEPGKVVLKVDGDDWIDVEMRGGAADGESGVAVADKKDGEPAATLGGEEEEVESKSDPSSKTDTTETKGGAPPVPKSRFSSIFAAKIKKKMERNSKRKQVEGSTTKPKPTYKYNADKAYEKQYTVAFAAHEFDKKKPDQILDLCLIMDCTGSMSSWIEHCKETLHNVIDETVKRDPNCKVRVAFVGYRDFCDGDDLFSLHDFTYDVDKVKQYISKCSAKGGGDFPEDVQGAIRKALDLNWSGLDDSVKLAVFVADAPAHGRKYHLSSALRSDDFPDGNPAGLVLEDMMKEMSDKEILISLYQLNNENETMYKIMKESHAKGEEKEGVEFVDLRHLKPTPPAMPASRKLRGPPHPPRRGPVPAMAMSAATYDAFSGLRRESKRREPEMLSAPVESYDRSSYRSLTSATIATQCSKMRSSARAVSRRSCKSGW